MFCNVLHCFACPFILRQNSFFRVATWTPGTCDIYLIRYAIYLIWFAYWHTHVRILTSSYLELSQRYKKKTARHPKLFAKSRKLFLRPAPARRAGMAQEQKSEAPTLCSFAFGICYASARRCEARTSRELSITSQIQRTFQSYSWVIPAPDCAVL